MAQQNILALAKQGNPKAIAALINRSLNSQGITAKVERTEGCLHVLLESERLPNQKALIPFIRKGLMGLGVQSINVVKIYGRQAGTDSPQWKQTIELSIDSAATSVPKLSEQKVSRSPLQNSHVAQIKPTFTAKQSAPVQQAVLKENPFLRFKIRSLLLWGILLSFLIGLGIGLSEIFTPLTLEEPFITPIVYILLFSSLCIWVLLRFKRLQINPQHIIGNFPPNHHWLITIGLVIAVFLFSIGSFYLLFYFISFTSPAFVESIFKEKIFLSASAISSSFLYNLIQFIVLVVVAPITEEFLFRGLILHRLAAKWGIGLAIIISSLIFGFLHANAIGLSMFGVVMALLYIKTRTLLVPIICHALNNGSVALVALLGTTSNATETTYKLEQFRADWWIGIVLLVLSAPWLIHFIYKNWPKAGSDLPYFANMRS
jgi:uncharacterized protein